MAEGRATAVPRPARDLRPAPGAAEFHLATALVATVALIVQVVLVARATGGALPTRLLRTASYFSLQSNALVAVTAWALWHHPNRGNRTLFKVVRLDAVLGIAVTGIVYVVVLRPVVRLEGWWSVAGTLLHYVVPLLAVVGWVVYGPRRRVDRRVVLLAMAWPVGFFGWSFLHGALTGFYPYPFVDVGDAGLGSVLLDAGLALVLLLLFAVGLLWVDRWLDARARRPRWMR